MVVSPLGEAWKGRCKAIAWGRKHAKQDSSSAFRFLGPRLQVAGWKDASRIEETVRGRQREVDGPQSNDQQRPSRSYKVRAPPRNTGGPSGTKRKNHPPSRRCPYAVLIPHPTLGEITVPSMRLIPLHQLSYLKIVCKIITANPTKEFSRFVLQEFWEAIIANVYDYEYTWREKKRTEVSSLYFTRVLEACHSH